MGWGDVTYNPQRKILGAIPSGGKTAYHLLNINPDISNASDIVKLCRKSKWHSQYNTSYSNLAISFIIKNVCISLGLPFLIFRIICH